MTGDWKPGDLAIVDYGTGSEVMMRDHWGWWSATTELSDSDDAVESIGPLAVIDPEDRQAVERFARRQQDLYYDSGSTPSYWDDLSHEQRQAVIGATEAALREFAAPTPAKPEVYEHVASYVPSNNGITTSLCGKTWKPGGDVVVVGKCPDCLDIVARWIA